MKSLRNKRIFIQLLLLLFVVFPSALLSQVTGPTTAATQANLEPVLAFEAPVTGSMPGGWFGGPAGTIFADDKIVHSGRWSVRLQRDATSANSFSTLTVGVPLEFTGKTVELRGYLRTEQVSEFAGLWMREDGETTSLAFDNMQSRQIKGNTDWTEYSIKLPVNPDATQLFFGVLVVGTGKAWADDLKLLIDDKPIWEAPKAIRSATVLDRDHEFDGGSKVVASQFSRVQLENLVTLGKVWGFLKYHHPIVTAGERHWDYELFRVLPLVLNAPDRASSNAVLVRWINSLGAVRKCDPCAQLGQDDLYLRPDLNWLNDEKRLGAELNEVLRYVYDHRSVGDQFYVTLAQQVQNPKFGHEYSYENVNFPDTGYQLLAVFRFWNAVEYWSPYRDIIGESWDAVLAEFIPRVALAKDSNSYTLELAALVARLHDGHANLWSAMNLLPPAGSCRLPVALRFVEGKPVVAAIDRNSGELKLGDELIEQDGTRISVLIENRSPYSGASNDAGRLRMMSGDLIRGACGEANVTVRRANQLIKLKVTRVAPKDAPQWWTHDLPGPTFRLLSKDVAYLKLSSVKAADVANYVEQASGTKGLVVDIRNYPSEFVVFALGSLLVHQSTPFARFTVGDLSNPGAFHWGGTNFLRPAEPHYAGKIVILVDETSMSQAEYTSMAFRAVPGSVVVGSMTSGADGNVSQLALPGGLNTMLSGIGVFYPDKKPTQRVGIIPDIVVKPTIAGISADRDEVLEEAIRQIVGSEVSESNIRKMIKTQ